MQLKNSAETYGLLTRLIHAVMALTIFGLFGLGIYMVDLSYYDSWYKGSIELHKSIGICLLTLWLIRVFWRFLQVQPESLSEANWEAKAAGFAHFLLYLIPLMVMISGYLISTADGRDILVFETVSVPALPAIMEEQEDRAGEVHEILAWALIVIASFHLLAALRHHFIKKNKTLRRMFF